jgi:hypothetical protein
MNDDDRKVSADAIAEAYSDTVKSLYIMACTNASQETDVAEAVVRAMRGLSLALQIKREMLAAVNSPNAVADWGGA